MQNIHIHMAVIHPDVQRVAAILQRRLEQRWGRQVPVAKGFTVELAICHGIGAEGFCITSKAEGCRIEGDCKLGLLYGVGKFLRSLLNKGGIWRCVYEGTSMPEKPMRGMYFATHFHNYYESAPVDEVLEYIEDIALWGVNTLSTWFDVHEYSGINDPAAQAMLTRLARFFAHARVLGLKTCINSLSNEAYATSPRNLRASSNGNRNGYVRNLTGHYHLEVCPSLCGGEQYIYDVRREICISMQRAGVTPDYWVTFPYDQGGCTCAHCAPWGINGFLRIMPGIAGIVREFFPQCKIVLSTWCFGSFIDGEWAGLTRIFANHKPEWVDILMIEPIVPGTWEYISDHGVPGGFPVIGFPEISMYGAVPWGGFGTNATPTILQKNWEQVRETMAGGLPYSEGIYEDINKAITAQHYWDSTLDAWGIAREYVQVEFSHEMADDIVAMLRIFERTLPRNRLDECNVNHNYPDYKIPWQGVQRFVITDTEGINQAYSLACRINTQLDACVKASWRWRLLFLRARIDYELLNNGFVINDALEECNRELTLMYHAQTAYYCVSPPALESISANRGGFSWTSDDE